MGDVMNFPERIEDFIEQYSFRDDEGTYTNGSKLIPVFRVKQAIEHYMPKWIPCSEMLPEESGTYIVNAIENHIVHVTFAKWMPRMKKWNFTGSRSYWKVTAWQPLPEPYKGE